MALLEWNESLSVGFEEIDEDHKRLIDIVNKLDDAIAAERETGEIEEVLEELVSYTVWHFRHEERLMQTHGDPTFFDHRKEHETLTDAVLAKQQLFQEGDPDVAKELMPFLKEWLTHHILGTDMKTGHYLAEHSD